MKFVKMHGIGNDYVFMDTFTSAMPDDPARLAIEMSRPHTGIGSDGLIIIAPDENADARMLMYNKDGSFGLMCGNGIRCVGKYLYDSGLVRKKTLRIAVPGGVRIIDMRIENGIATGARVDMGEPSFECKNVPVNSDSCDIDIVFPDGKTAKFTCLSMGNPHAVTLDRFPDDDAFPTDGVFIENHPLFPERVNACFLRVDDRRTLTAHIWERGSGATMACGSGSCAALAAAVRAGVCEREAIVKLPGGELLVEWDKNTNHIFMTGAAETCFSGEWLK